MTSNFLKILALASATAACSEPEPRTTVPSSCDLELEDGAWFGRAVFTDQTPGDETIFGAFSEYLGDRQLVEREYFLVYDYGIVTMNIPDEEMPPDLKSGGTRVSVSVDGVTTTRFWICNRPQADTAPAPGA